MNIPVRTFVLLSSLLLVSCARDQSIDHRAAPANVPTPGTTSQSTPEATLKQAGKPSAKSPSPTRFTQKIKVMSEEEIPENDAGWRRILTDEQFRVLRGHDTEPAFTGALWDNKKAGAYRCAGCGALLFESDTKFRSPSGWPSFYAPAAEKSVENTVDKSFGLVRVEVHCKRCGGHLGHVFDDGPVPTGKRYCINSAALRFESRE